MVEGQEGVTWPQCVALAQATEAAGLEGLFRSDHYRSIVRGDPAGSLDAWATLAGLAARTDRIRLGTMVSPVTFRRASVLAKNATAVDHISNGRVELGIGAGWYEAEHETYGFPFLTSRWRLDELDRQLAEITRRWTEAPDVWPKPIQEPRPPIIVGGRARPRTVSAAVWYADEYNTTFPTLDDVRERKAALDDAAAAAGRQPLRFSMMIGCVAARNGAELDARLKDFRELTGSDRPALAGTVDELADQLREYERAGIGRAMLQHLVHQDAEMGHVLGELAARLP